MTTTTDKGLTDEELMAMADAWIEKVALLRACVKNTRHDTLQSADYLDATFGMVRALIERARAAERERDELKAENAHLKSEERQ